MSYENTVALMTLISSFPASSLLYRFLKASTKYLTAFSLLVDALGKEKIQEYDGAEGTELMRTVIVTNSEESSPDYIDSVMAANVRKLLDIGIPPQKSKKSCIESSKETLPPLFYCRTSKCYLTAKLLIEAGADVNHISPKGTILHIVTNKHLTKLFRESGFNLLTTEYKGIVSKYCHGVRFHSVVCSGCKW